MRLKIINKEMVIKLRDEHLAYVESLEKENKELKEENKELKEALTKQQGEWIYDDIQSVWICSKCRNKAIREYIFCPNCGVKNVNK